MMANEILEVKKEYTSLIPIVEPNFIPYRATISDNLKSNEYTVNTRIIQIGYDQNTEDSERNY